MRRVISDVGKPVAVMCESSLQTEDTQVAASGWNTTPVFSVILAARLRLSLVLLEELCRHTTAAFRGNVKPVLEREILESCDKVNG